MHWRGGEQKPHLAAWKAYLDGGEDTASFQAGLVRCLAASHEQFQDKSRAGDPLCPPGTAESTVDPAVRERVTRRLTLHRFQTRATPDRFLTIWKRFVDGGETEAAFIEALESLGMKPAGG